MVLHYVTFDFFVGKGFGVITSVEKLDDIFFNLGRSLWLTFFKRKNEQVVSKFYFQDYKKYFNGRNFRGTNYLQV